jgi:hypothetical protein
VLRIIRNSQWEPLLLTYRIIRYPICATGPRPKASLAVNEWHILRTMAMD